MRALIFSNGKPRKGVMVNRALSDSNGAQVIAADGGARIAWRYGHKPDVVIGDMDSLSEKELNRLESDGAELIRYPSEKDETDLELALVYAAEHDAEWIRIIGAIGGRFDQMLANVYLLSLPELENCDLAMVARNQIIRLFRPGIHHIEGKPDDTLSLIPISGDVIGITSEGLQYPLRDEILVFGPARGISNVMLTDRANIKFEEGLLLSIHTDGDA